MKIVAHQAVKLADKKEITRVGDLNSNCHQSKVTELSGDIFFNDYIGVITEIQSRPYKKPCVDKELLEEVKKSYRVRLSDEPLEELTQSSIESLNMHMFGKKDVIKGQYCGATFMDTENERICFDKEFFSEMREVFPDQHESFHLFFVAHEFAHHLQLIQCCKNKGILMNGQECNAKSFEHNYDEIHKETDTYAVLLAKQLGWPIDYEKIADFFKLTFEAYRADNILKAARSFNGK